MCGNISIARLYLQLLDQNHRHLVRLEPCHTLLHRAIRDALKISCTCVASLQLQEIARLRPQVLPWYHDAIMQTKYWQSLRPPSLLDQIHNWWGSIKVINYYTGLLVIYKIWNNSLVIILYIQLKWYDITEVLTKVVSPPAASEHSLLGQNHNWWGSSKDIYCCIVLSMIVWSIIQSVI